MVDHGHPMVFLDIGWPYQRHFDEVPWLERVAAVPFDLNPMRDMVLHQSRWSSFSLPATPDKLGRLGRVTV